MNTCLILVIVTTVVTTTAQDTPIFFTATELTAPNPDFNKDDIFKEDEEEVIDYSTSALTTGAQDLPDIFKEDEENVIYYSSLLSTRARNGDEEKVIKNSTSVSTTGAQDFPVNLDDENTVIEYFGFLSRTDAQNLPGIFEEDEEHVIEYSTIATGQIDEVQNRTPVSTTTTFDNITIPKTNLSINFAFDDFDTMNEDETALFEGYNQTILNDMRKQEIDKRETSTQETVTALPPLPMVPPRYTTPLIIYELNMSLFDLPPTTPAPSELTTATHSRQTTPGDTIVTPVDTGDRNSDYPDEYPEPVTEDPEFNEEEDENDPCNYEKKTHPLPEVEKTGRRVSEIKCEKYMWYYKINVLDVEIKRKECAEQMKRKKEQTTQVVGGVKAVQGDFPHMGAVGWIRMDGSLRWMCGSSLISPRFTLTAAHCRNASARLGLRYTEPRVVRFGSVFLESKDEATKNLRGHDVLIAEFLVLEAYAKEPVKKYNDVGLIRLREEVLMTDFIKPACLWTGFLGNILNANITGWGTTKNEGLESNHLRYAEVDFIDKSTCKKYIHGRRNRHWPQGLKDHQFCAGKLKGGIDACQGDSGGPLQFREPMPAAMNSTDVVHRVVGITNFGVKCAYPFLPGVYTNVTSFICWIEKNVWPEENNAFCP